MEWFVKAFRTAAHPCFAASSRPPFGSGSSSSSASAFGPRGAAVPHSLLQPLVGDAIKPSVEDLAGATLVSRCRAALVA